VGPAAQHLDPGPGFGPDPGRQRVKAHGEPPLQGFLGVDRDQSLVGEELGDPVGGVHPGDGVGLDLSRLVEGQDAELVADAAQSRGSPAPSLAELVIAARSEATAGSSVLVGLPTRAAEVSRQELQLPRMMDGAVMIYWHVERKSLCIYSQLRACSSSEVAAMIEGLVRHCTDMTVERNYVDSHGQSEVAFAFCHLLGFQLLPRLKGIHAQKLYRPQAGQPSAYPNLQPVLTRPINWGCR